MEKNAEEYIAKQKAALAQNAECGNSHYNLAVAYLGQKKYDEAEQSLQEAISCSPNLAEAYVQLGGICLYKNDLDGCLYYNKRAVKARAGFSIGHGNIGFVELQRGNVEAAIKSLKKAISFNSSFLQAQATLANAYLMNGEIKESIEANKKALKLEPNFAVSHFNLALAYLEDNQKELAIEHSKKAVELGYEIPPELEKDFKE
ncbi:MAG: tetratricopeptide repeat protein [Desulfobacterales bacterium]|nr:tetratricopeptide repeat protein [Desulfobacterales bacterium]MCP4160976.1 tetratricopeptide repeat protein [Deltaproteobacteria bacterium]